ncbi:MAG: N-acetylmuramoyl-L-alanine amidase [Anaerolineae bacterium]|nr:N-acetylmuramoyl-L-alanine amidase [Anaerolineae bacterium]
MSLLRRNVLEGVQRVLIAALVIILVALIYMGARIVWALRYPELAASPTLPMATRLATLQTPPNETLIPTAVPIQADGTPIPALTQTALAQSTPGAVPLKIGIVAGHWQNDAGAVCDDGLMEVEINIDIAQRVVSQLAMSGYSAEMLAEFSPKLSGYQAAALVSIHTDACNVPEATGFKVARVSSSLVPDIEDALVSCLISKYRESTGLQVHRNSITFDMTEYHAFYEIAPQTPGAIIEIGFMGADRYLLTHRQDLVTEGIVNGIKCFIESVYR